MMPVPPQPNTVLDSRTQVRSMRAGRRPMVLGRSARLAVPVPTSIQRQPQVGAFQRSRGDPGRGSRESSSLARGDPRPRDGDAEMSPGYSPTRWSTGTGMPGLATVKNCGESS